MLEPTLPKGSGCAEPTHTCSQPRKPNINKSISLAQQVRTICLQVSSWHQAAAHRCGVTLAAGWQSPHHLSKPPTALIPWRGLGWAAEPDGEGWEHLPPPLPLGQAVGVDVQCPPSSAGGAVHRTLADVGVLKCGTSTHCQGWWRAQHPVLPLHPTDSHSSRLRELRAGSGSQ